MARGRKKMTENYDVAETDEVYEPVAKEAANQRNRPDPMASEFIMRIVDTFCGYWQEVREKNSPLSN